MKKKIGISAQSINLIVDRSNGKRQHLNNELEKIEALLYSKKKIDIRDIEKLQRKLIMKKITPKDFTILYNNISNILLLYNNINKDKVLFKYLLNVIGIIDNMSYSFSPNSDEKIHEFTPINLEDEIGLKVLGSLPRTREIGNFNLEKSSILFEPIYNEILRIIQ